MDRGDVEDRGRGQRPCFFAVGLVVVSFVEQSGFQPRMDRPRLRPGRTGGARTVAFHPACGMGVVRRAVRFERRRAPAFRGGAAPDGVLLGEAVRVAEGDRTLRKVHSAGGASSVVVLFLTLIRGSTGHSTAIGDGGYFAVVSAPTSFHFTFHVTPSARWRMVRNSPSSWRTGVFFLIASRTLRRVSNCWSHTLT